MLETRIRRQALSISLCEGERIEVRGLAIVLRSAGHEPSPCPLP